MTTYEQALLAAERELGEAELCALCECDPCDCETVYSFTPACPICAGAHRATKCPEVAKNMIDVPSLVASRDDALTLIAALRAQLATAHEVVGALLGPEGNTMAVKQAARAWLRREAK